MQNCEHANYLPLKIRTALWNKVIVGEVWSDNSTEAIGFMRTIYMHPHSTTRWLPCSPALCIKKEAVKRTEHGTVAISMLRLSLHEWWWIRAHTQDNYCNPQHVEANKMLWFFLSTKNSTLKPRWIVDILTKNIMHLFKEYLSIPQYDFDQEQEQLHLMQYTGKYLHYILLI